VDWLKKYVGVALLILVLLSACSRAPIKERAEALRKVSAPDLSDDLALSGTSEGLLEAVRIEIIHFEKQSPTAELTFAEEKYTAAEYLAGLRNLEKQIGEKGADRGALFKAIEEQFDFYQVYGEKSWGDVFMTGYFEPVLKGSKKKKPPFTQALYKTPEDLLLLDLNTFDGKYQHDRKLRARLEGNRVVPYYTREEIDSRGVLNGKKLELAWVDVLEAHALQVQGSGVIEFEDGTSMRLGYAEKNGQRYEPVGKFIKGGLPPGTELNALSIDSYLRSLSELERQAYLNRNPSYVFFREAEQNAITAMGVPATSGRTIATDPRWFPKGALCFLKGSRPQFASDADTQPKEWTPFSRFVFDQDTGGAIQGSGRLDLFVGRGKLAGREAGFHKQRGELYYLAPKRERK